MGESTDLDAGCHGPTESTRETEKRLQREAQLRELREQVEERRFQEERRRLIEQLESPTIPEASAASPVPSSAAVHSAHPTDVQQMWLEMQRQQAEANKLAVQQAEQLRQEREAFMQIQEDSRKRQEEQTASRNAEQERRAEEKAHSEAQVAALLKQHQKLEARVNAPSVAPSASSAEMDKTIKDLNDQIAAQKRDAERSHSSHRSYRSRPERGDSANDAELTAITSNAASLRSATAEQQRKSSVRRESVKRQSRALPCEASVTASYRRAQQEMDTAMKGMDITIMMDCTGSMARLIDSCRKQISAICKIVQTDYPEAIIRVAFIGYKDHGDGNQRILFHHFVEKQNIHQLEHFIAQIRAGGGDDGPEDIAGGLEECVKLTLNKGEQGFRAQTRMIIHFADAPCHGSKYHDGLYDNYPGGDPHGLQPEELLTTLAKKNVDYYFIAVAPQYTTKMTDIFQKCYPQTANASCGFKVLPSNASPASFMPAMLDSIKRSASRASSYHSKGSIYGGYVVESESDDEADPCDRYA